MDSRSLNWLLVCVLGVGFLEYRKLDGSWRPFLFQTSDYQLVIYRVHVRIQYSMLVTPVLVDAVLTQSALPYT